MKKLASRYWDLAITVVLDLIIFVQVVDMVKAIMGGYSNTTSEAAGIIFLAFAARAWVKTIVAKKNPKTSDATAKSHTGPLLLVVVVISVLAFVGNVSERVNEVERSVDSVENTVWDIEGRLFD